MKFKHKKHGLIVERDDVPPYHYKPIASGYEDEPKNYTIPWFVVEDSSEWEEYPASLKTVDRDQILEAFLNSKRFLLDNEFFVNWPEFRKNLGV